MLIMACLLFFSVLVGKAGSRFGMPALLLFLGVGMVAGVDGFGLHFDNAMTAQSIGMISLSIILFSGGVDTNFKEIKPVLAPGTMLATVGVFITTAVTGAFIYYMFRWLAPEHSFGLIESFLLAAIMSSTDSASVFSILNSSRTSLKQNLKPTLELESGSNDPMAYLLVIILIGIMEGGNAADAALWWHSAGLLVMQLVLGAIGGVAVGFATVAIVNRLRVDNEFLYPIMVIACAFFAFSLSKNVPSSHKSSRVSPSNSAQ